MDIDALVDELEDFESIFKKATLFVRAEAAKLKSDKLLYLYARFKQVSEGPCCTPKPGFFDFHGKQKWEAWKKLGKMSKDTAMEEYVEAVSVIDPQWEQKMDCGEVKSGMGVSVSTLAMPEDAIDDADKTIFDWCKEGHVAEVTRILSRQGAAVNDTDEEGMTLLHWAADRGYDCVVEQLLRMKADINATDYEGQTALHYAASCDHVAVVQCLVANDADVTIRDNDNMAAVDLAEQDHMKHLLEAR